jgi:hypothetical protein
MSDTGGCQFSQVCAWLRGWRNMARFPAQGNFCLRAVGCTDPLIRGHCGVESGPLACITLMSWMVQMTEFSSTFPIRLYGLVLLHRDMFGFILCDLMMSLLCYCTIYSFSFFVFFFFLLLLLLYGPSARFRAMFSPLPGLVA